MSPRAYDLVPASPCNTSWGPILTHPILPRMDQGAHGGCPGEQRYMLLQSCAGPAGHHWHLGVPLCLPAASGESRASPPPPRARDPGTYAAFSRRGNTTCSASCSAPGRKGGEPIAPVPPSMSPQPPAPRRAWPLPPSCGHPWLARAPERRGMAQLIPNAVQAERAESSFPALWCARTQPGASTHH